MDKSAIHEMTLRARELLTGEIRDLLQGIYGLDGKGEFEDKKAARGPVLAGGPGDEKASGEVS